MDFLLLLDVEKKLAIFPHLLSINSGGEKLNKKIRMTLGPALALLTLFAMAPAMATACSPHNSTTTTRGDAYGMSYTQTTGTLGGANYVVRIPDTWNRMLIIGCHAYSYNRAPNQELQFDALAAVFIAQGYAYAASDYGAQGYCVKDGMISTHQLTEYVISRYHVTGKIFLFGGSMGGQIALLLGEKYPCIYSGVLDICGPKDMVSLYAAAFTLAISSVDQIRAILNWPNPPVSDETVLGFKYFSTVATADIVVETGGTPQTVLQAYEEISPVDHADISIPVISLVGGADFVVPLAQTLEYQSAVVADGSSDWYRMKVVETGGHLDAITLAQVPAALSELISWSNTAGRRIPVTVTIHPSTFNLKCSSPTVIVSVELPKCCHLANAKISSLCLADSIEAKRIFYFGHTIIGAFDGRAVKELLSGECGKTELTIAGTFTDGTYFQGSDMIKVIKR